MDAPDIRIDPTVIDRPKPLNVTAISERTMQTWATDDPTAAPILTAHRADLDRLDELYAAAEDARHRAATTTGPARAAALYDCLTLDSQVSRLWTDLHHQCQDIHRRAVRHAVTVREEIPR